MRKEEIIKVTIIIILVLVVIGITGCQTQIPCSIEITSPDLWESVNGNEPYEITWDWTGTMNKKVDIFLVGYTKEEIIGLTISELVPKDFIKTLMKMVSR